MSVPFKILLIILHQFIIVNLTVSSIKRLRMFGANAQSIKLNDNSDKIIHHHGSNTLTTY